MPQLPGLIGPDGQVWLPGHEVAWGPASPPPTVTVTLSTAATVAAQCTEYTGVGLVETNVGGLAGSGTFPQATETGTVAANALNYICGAWVNDEIPNADWDNSHTVLPASLTTFGIGGASGIRGFAGWRTYATASGAITPACSKDVNNIYCTTYASFAPIGAGPPAFVANSHGGATSVATLALPIALPTGQLVLAVAIRSSTVTSTAVALDGYTWTLVRRTVQATAPGVTVELWLGVGAWVASVLTQYGGRW